MEETNDQIFRFNIRVPVNSNKIVDKIKAEKDYGITDDFFLNLKFFTWT